MCLFVCEYTGIYVCECTGMCVYLCVSMHMLVLCVNACVRVYMFVQCSSYRLNFSLMPKRHAVGEGLVNKL